MTVATLKLFETLTNTHGTVLFINKDNGHYTSLHHTQKTYQYNSVTTKYTTEEVEDSVGGYSSLSEEAVDDFLDKEIEKGEITKCVRKLKNYKTGGSDGIVGELLKYGGLRMVDLLEQLFSVIWLEQIVPRKWRDGLIVNIFKKGDREILVIIGVSPYSVL